MQTQHFFDPQTNTLTYVVFDPASRDAVVIDPVLDYDPAGGACTTTSADAVTRFLRDEGLQLRWVLETHAHADHLSGAQLLRTRFGAPVAIGARIVEVQRAFKPILGLAETFPADGSQFDHLLADGETLAAGTLRIEVLATPGHTPACVTYRIDDALFTGDALFLEDLGTGRCDFPNGSADALYDSVQRLYALPDDTKVHPGHDYPSGREVRWETTLGEEKRRNVQLRADTPKEAYVTMRRTRDATLKPPRLLFPSLRVNVDAGHLPAPRADGRRFLAVPLTAPAEVS